MATASGLARVAQINATIAKQGQAAPSATSTSGGSGSSGSAVYYKDAPGYVAGSSPTDSSASRAAYAAGLNAPTQPIAQPTPTTAPIAEIQTGQPSPNTANATPFTNQTSTAKTSAQATPEQVQAVAEATRQVNDLASQYKTGLANVQAQGLPPSNTQGQAMGTVQANLPNSQQEAPSIVGSIMETDSNFDSILTMYDDFMSPQTQRTSLLEEYQQMSKTLGIEQMNAELINSKRIIEGTEDDIRSEITAVGGFGTESQVLAMANARNKSLIKNYNYLLESRDSAMTQLNTMMNLSIQDRQMAEAEFDRKMNFAFKVQEFQERAVTNARENYNNIVKAVGYGGLLTATNGNAYEQSLIEKTLGLGSGGLQKLANTVIPLTEMEQAELAYKKAQTSKLYSDIKTQEDKTTTSKPATQAQLQIAGYRDRLNEANRIINTIGGQFTGSFDVGGSLPNQLQSESRQSYEQAKRNFINSVLRRESGAAISPSEFDNAEKQYFPQRGDKPGVVQQKANNRQTVINSFTRESSAVVSPNVVVGPDGGEYEIIN